MWPRASGAVRCSRWCTAATGGPSSCAMSSRRSARNTGASRWLRSSRPGSRRRTSSTDISTWAALPTPTLPIRPFATTTCCWPCSTKCRRCTGWTPAASCSSDSPAAPTLRTAFCSCIRTGCWRSASQPRARSPSWTSGATGRPGFAGWTAASARSRTWHRSPACPCSWWSVAWTRTPAESRYPEITRPGSKASMTRGSVAYNGSRRSGAAWRRPGSARSTRS